MYSTGWLAGVSCYCVESSNPVSQSASWQHNSQINKEIVISEISYQNCNQQSVHSRRIHLIVLWSKVMPFQFYIYDVSCPESYESSHHTNYHIVQWSYLGFLVLPYFYHFVFFRYSNVTIMGGVSSVPQIIGGLATRLLYYLIGANYNSQSISSTVNKGDQALERWRGKDYHVYDRYG